MQQTLKQTIQAMAITVEKREPYTAGRQRRGKLYDPMVVDACLEVLKEPHIKSLLEALPVNHSNSQD